MASDTQSFEMVDRRDTHLPNFEESQQAKLLEENARSPNERPASAQLGRSIYIFWIAFFYSSIAVVSWTLICILSHRPLTATTYAFSNDLNIFASDKHSDYVASERWYQAMRVVQSVVGVLTIPITSAVCSSAAAAFVQFSKRSHGLSMRQTMVLADRGWTDPFTYVKLVVTRSGLKRYGSLFLLVAIFLNVSVTLGDRSNARLTDLSLGADTRRRHPTTAASLPDVCHHQDANPTRSTIPSCRHPRSLRVCG